MDTVLIIDDEKKFADLLARILTIENYRVKCAHDAKSALLLLAREHIEAIICDVKLPDAYGVELVTKLLKLAPNAAIILLTAFGNIPDAVQAVKNGAYQYLVKGDDNNQIIPILAEAIRKKKENNPIQAPAHIGENENRAIIATNELMQTAIQLANRVAKTTTTVLLRGETGTGKEVFAQYIHAQSTRAQKPLIAVNCGALGKDILESELFGYKAGAFTGAIKDKKGLLQAAEGGTLFLDEVGEMSPDLQTKLLRVLETQTFTPVGGQTPQRIDVRFISATHRDLKQSAAQGSFRLDLYYRLVVFEILLPPLRERKGDILPLAETFIAQLSTKMNRKGLKMSPAFEQKLLAHQWQGNVRELKNVIERAIILSDDCLLSPDVLPLDWEVGEQNPTTSFELAEVEKQHILKILAFTQYNKTETARLLNIGLTTLYRKLEEYKIAK